MTFKTMFQTDDYGLMTPGRHTYLEVDLPETVLISPQWAHTRMGGEVATPSIEKDFTTSAQNVYFWKSLQAWTLKPVQTDVSLFNEYAKYEYLVIRLGRWNAQLYKPASGGAVSNGGTVGETGMDEEYVQKNSDDLVGMPAGGTTGGLLQKPGKSDPHIIKKVPAGKSWEVSTEKDRKVDYNVPMDTIAVSKETFPADAGFFLRFSLVGNPQTTPDVIWTFYFGQYAVVFNGHGYCYLLEDNPDPDSTEAYVIRTTFRYAQPAQVASIQHTLAIWPAYNHEGKRYIAFSNTQMEAAGTAIAFSQPGYSPLPVSQNVYLVDGYKEVDIPDQSPGHVTRADTVAVDVRRDIRLKWQVSELGFAENGYLEDLPVAIPPYIGGGSNLKGRLIKRINEGVTSIGADVYEASTDEKWEDGKSQYSPYVVFTFTGDGKSTPFLYGYQLTKDAVTEYIQPGKFVCEDMTDIELEMFSGDVQSDGGSITLPDWEGQYTRLRNRGQLSSRLSTDYLAPNGNVYNVRLHQGYIHRPKAADKGTYKARILNPYNTGSVSTGYDQYPSPLAREFNLPIISMWQRLQERVETTYWRIFAQDDFAPPDPISGVSMPWKVTDVIVNLLMAAGFTSDQIRIPDLPYRLWPGQAAKTPDEWQIKPEQGYAEIIQRLAKNYLGAYLYWEANYTNGAWSLIFNALDNSDPVYAFTTESINGPNHLTRGYYENVGPVLSKPDYENIPPDFNFVTVLCPVNLDKNARVGYINFLHNPLSCNVPGYTSIANPDHPDYLGRVISLVIIDPSLAGVPIGGYDAGYLTQLAVDWTVQRLYDTTCHTQKLVRFLSPLAIIWDDLLKTYRPVRYQDKVLFNGDEYRVKAVRANYRHSHSQLATYELIQAISQI